MLDTGHFALQEDGAAIARYVTVSWRAPRVKRTDEADALAGARPRSRPLSFHVDRCGRRCGQATASQIAPARPQRDRSRVRHVWLAATSLLQTVARRK